MYQRGGMHDILTHLAGNAATRHENEARAYVASARKFNAQIASVRARPSPRTAKGAMNRQATIAELMAKRELVQREATRHHKLAREYRNKGSGHVASHPIFVSQRDYPRAPGAPGYMKVKGQYVKENRPVKCRPGYHRDAVTGRCKRI